MSEDDQSIKINSKISKESQQNTSKCTGTKKSKSKKKLEGSNKENSKASKVSA